LDQSNRKAGADSTGTLILLAPLDGWAAPLSEVPDKVFAEKMLGEGVAIDPISAMLTAPCDGEVILLHAASHAITLRARNGAEILMHIGLDTVTLGGKGFRPHVRLGQSVTAGAPLISFDLQLPAEKAKSLITPIIVTNSGDFAIDWRLENAPVRRGQDMMRVGRLKEISACLSVGQEVRRDLVISLAHGLHARPAARLAGLAKSFSCEIVMASGSRRANLRSPVAIMALGISQGAAVSLVANGRDAADAIAAITSLMESGMDDRAHASETVFAAAQGEEESGLIKGVRAAPGLAVGKALKRRNADLRIEEQGKGIAEEKMRLREAIARVKVKLSGAARRDRSAILSAQLAFLDDPQLVAEAAQVMAEGKSAAYAWRTAIRTQVAILKGLGQSRFAERASDLIDLERQVLVALGYGGDQPSMLVPEGAILLAEDLLPSEFLALDAGRLGGIALAQGGPTSHVAILAATMDIPMLVACGPKLLSIPDEASLLLDADQAALAIDPDLALLNEANQRIAHRRRASATARNLAHQACHTMDGQRVEIHANLGSVTDAMVAMAAGAEGCGLLRTEFLFLDREAPPSEAEQAEAYHTIAQALEGKPLTVRLLDIGGDKPAPYLPFPLEENPALGLRGVRVNLWHPELLAVQLRAILQAVPARQCRIMVPMISSLSELRAVRRALDRARAELGIDDPISLGVMVETPSAAITADLLAAEADFLSIGTNDLTQYCLAMDRGNAQLATSFDALHPAVLRLIAATTEGAGAHGRAVSVCGGLASEVLAAPILIGLGVRGLSAAAARIPALKARIGALTLDQCRQLAKNSLAASSAADVRGLALSKGEN
jgi:multiphosphoryl transfer protein